ncbi:MAG: universal stress protein [Bacteroidales bacterium]|nr:universal stress protein [Bacteroidales bacterium]
MADIIVGVDFSDGSLNALKYAVYIAEKIGTGITMLYVDKPHNPQSIYREDSSYRDEIHSRFEELMSYYRPMIGDHIKYKVRTGKVYEEIAVQARLQNASLIVVGTHGISGFEELWIGSNANRIVSTAPCPVITIRQTFTFNDSIVQRILLPIDRTPDTTLKVPIVLPLAQKFNSHIVLLKLFTTNLSTLKKRVNTTAESVIKDIEKTNLSYSIRELIVTNLTADILRVIEEEKCDFLSISTEQYNQQTLIMLGESAQQVVNTSPIPVLSVHPHDKSIF